MKSLSNQTKRKISLGLNFIVIVMELIALVQSANKNGTALFRYYTEDSNLFALVTSIILVVFLIRYQQGKNLPTWLGRVKYMSACCLSITFIVVIAVLAPMMGGVAGYRMMLLDGSMLYHHLLCPIIIVISFVFFDPLPVINKKDIFLSLIPTLSYAFITVILNIAKLLDGPYPFLRVYNQPIIISCLWFVVIIGLAYLIGWLLQLGFKRFH